ncbi:MAG: hypothetical protein H8D67_22995 [Deltaproteobacteria bacterium]|nr:hypothetical protein [Deltaproteobacteria bacterium]
MIRTVGKPYLHFVLPPAIGKCECGGLGIIKPIDGRDSRKYSFSLSCEHKPNNALKVVAKKYYSDRVRTARKHIKDCVAEGVQPKRLHRTAADW